MSGPLRVFGGVGLVSALVFATGLGMAAPVMGAELALSGYTQSIAVAASEDRALAAFYAARDYRPIWTSAEDAGRREALFRALDGAWAHGLPVKAYDPDGLRRAFADVKSERQRGALEVAVSKAYLAYAHDVSSGVINPASVDKSIVREITRRDPVELLTGVSGAAPQLFLRELAPQAPQYALLLKARLDLEAKIAKGGWGATVPGGKLEPGDSGARVVALRDRLRAMGYLGRSASAVYDADIQKAVQQYQADLGLTADGVAGGNTLTELNRSPEERMQSILVALERLRWMNGIDLGKRHIWVNIPDFRVRIVDHGKISFESVVVVGQNSEDRRTPEFSDQMELMVINPSWHVPRSIVVKEYLPMMQKNAGAAGHIQLIDDRGRTVSRDAVDFSQYSAKNFPFAMKQAPSNSNALGLVKFLFPNKHNIYLHDTPSKSLFQRESRAFSHGCVRVGRPFDLAYELLAAQSTTPQDDFQRILRTGQETTVAIKDPVPVHLVYYTAWPTARGKVEYRRDVYGRDAAIFAALSKAGVELPLLSN